MLKMEEERYKLFMDVQRERMELNRERVRERLSIEREMIEMEKHDKWLKAELENAN